MMNRNGTGRARHMKNGISGISSLRIRPALETKTRVTPAQNKGIQL